MNMYIVPAVSQTQGEYTTNINPKPKKIDEMHKKPIKCNINTVFSYKTTLFFIGFYVYLFSKVMYTYTTFVKP